MVLYRRLLPCITSKFPHSHPFFFFFFFFFFVSRGKITPQFTTQMIRVNVSVSFIAVNETPNVDYKNINKIVLNTLSNILKLSSCTIHAFLTMTTLPSGLCPRVPVHKRIDVIS